MSLAAPCCTSERGGMTILDELLSNNYRFAATDAKRKVPRIPFLPHKQVYVLTCIDPRVDPAATLGLDLGDAIVARTVGGRANEAFLEDLAWICYLHETKTPDAEWFELLVVHHTDCGSALMADDVLRKGFAARGHDDTTLRATAVTEPASTVRADVSRILDTLGTSSPVRVAGGVYDVTTGLFSLVSPVRAAR
jgi:carbonic anhydrase